MAAPAPNGHGCDRRALWNGHQRIHDAISGLVGILVLPHSDNEPAQLGQVVVGRPVPDHVLVQLGRPPGAVRPRGRRVRRAGMPEAAVDEDGDPLAGERDVHPAPRHPRHRPLLAKSEPAPVQLTA